jgi:hypothetical protein
VLQFLSFRCALEQFLGFWAEIYLIEALFLVQRRAADHGIQLSDESLPQVGIRAALIVREQRSGLRRELAEEVLGERTSDP